LETPEIFAYVKCKNCKSLALVNPPVDSQLGLYYPTDYAPYVVKPESLGTIGYPKQILSRLISGPRSDINILDYGCGNGTWLAQAANTFEGAKLHAVDFNPSEAISRIHWIGKDVNVVSPQDFLLSQQVYDVINFGHSIEHVSNPIDVIGFCASRLSEKGVMSVACPVSDSLSLSVLRSFWQGLEAPRHLSIPSIKALNSILEKSSLLVIESHSYGSPVVFLRSLNYSRNYSVIRNFFISKLLEKAAQYSFANKLICRFKRSSKFSLLAARKAVIS
jgi:SAM-dependent methyltransferase